MSKIDDQTMLAAKFQRTCKGVVDGDFAKKEKPLYLNLVKYLAGKAVQGKTITNPLIDQDMEQAVTAIINQSDTAETDQPARLREFNSVLQTYIDSDEFNAAPAWVQQSAVHLQLDVQSRLENQPAVDKTLLLAKFEGQKIPKQGTVVFKFALGDAFDEKEVPRYLDVVRYISGPITIGGKTLPPFIQAQDVAGVQAYIQGNGIIDPNRDAVALYIMDVLDKVMASDAFKKAPIDMGASIAHLHQDIAARMKAEGLAVRSVPAEARVSAEEPSGGAVDAQLALAREVMAQGTAVPDGYYHQYQDWRFDLTEIERKLPGRSPEILELLIASELVKANGETYSLSPSSEGPKSSEAIYEKWVIQHTFTRGDFAGLGDKAGMAFHSLQEWGYLDQNGQAVSPPPSKRIATNTFSQEEVRQMMAIIEETKVGHLVTKEEAAKIFMILQSAYAGIGLDRNTRTLGNYTLSETIFPNVLDFGGDSE